MDKQKFPLPRWWIAFCLLLVLAFLLYYPGIHGPFMLDDLFVIQNNRHLSPEALDLASLQTAALSAPQVSLLRRPIAMASFALNIYLTGDPESPTIKLVNILIHLSSGVLVLLLSLQLSTLLARRGQPMEHPRPLALLVAALWLLHPLHVSTVLYAVQRMTQLAAFFTLLGVVTYLSFRLRLQRGEKKALWGMVPSLGLCGLLAVLSKENGGLLPLFLLLVEGLFFRFHLPPSLDKLRTPMFILLAGPVLLLMAFVGVYLATHPELFSGRPFTLTERLLTESRILFFYLRLLLFPDIRAMGLYHDDFALSLDLLTPWSTLPAVLSLLALVTVTGYWAMRGRYTVFTFACFWFLGGHLLESTVIPLELIFEHRNYLPAFGPLFAAGYVLTHPRLHGRMEEAWVHFAFIAAFLVAPAWQLSQRALQWSTPYDFAVSEVEHHPHSARAWSSLSFALFNKGLLREALPPLRQATLANPVEAGYPMATLYILLLLDDSPDPEAEKTTLDRMARHPGSALSYMMFSNFFNTLKRKFPLDGGRDRRDWMEMADRLFSAVAGKEDWISPQAGQEKSYYHAGYAKYWLGHYPEAERHWLSAQRTNPQRVETKLRLVDLYLSTNQPEKAHALLQTMGHLSGKNIEALRRRYEEATKSGRPPPTAPTDPATDRSDAVAPSRQVKSHHLPTVGNGAVTTVGGRGGVGDGDHTIQLCRGDNGGQ